MTPNQAATARALRYDARVLQLAAAPKPMLLAHLRMLWARTGRAVLAAGRPVELWTKAEIEKEIIWLEFPETDPGRRIGQPTT